MVLSFQGGIPRPWFFRFHFSRFLFFCFYFFRFQSSCVALNFRKEMMVGNSSADMETQVVL